MKKGDIVRVFKQPKDMYHQVEGEIGFIEETNKTHASIMALRPDGSCGGGGRVPLDCLTLETDPAWLRAKKAYDARMDALRKEYDLRTKRYNKVLKHVAKKYNISKKKAENIYNDLNEWEEYYRENFT